MQCEVSKANAEIAAKQLGASRAYIECSAKYNESVDDVFDAAADLGWLHLHPEAIDSSDTPMRRRKPCLIL
jgi:hypothetical protein